MKIAFVLFDGVTFLDFVGFYDVIYNLNQFEASKGISWDICGLTEEITDELGMTVKVQRVRPPLADYDMVFVPGGMGTRKLRYDETFVNWLREAQDVKYKVSVCTGSLLWGAAGVLHGKKATTHPRAYDLLSEYCEVVQERIVRDGNVITAGGVATSIDLGLYMIELFAGTNAMHEVKQQIDYPYTPPKVVEILR
ncbi:DJ-1/PfpI family protein [Paenibacillus guangzhouensis]|uniref:DJ-1/PfpI family protein n=1 Tax=Paenibacillus guangzhouensis TaxID=1473112 RepID=UPI001266DCC9|nr:DJ-1/PfpI family protein [Paenibacillus guangzhouensis]